MLDRPTKDYSDFHNGNDLGDHSCELIKDSYKASLVLPLIMPSRQFILCPVGLVGSGKSTIIKPLSERLDLLIISADQVRKLLYDNGFNLMRLNEIITSVIDDYLGLGFSIAIDSDSVNAVNLCEGRKNKYGIKLIWIHINPPEDYILNKLKNYKHTWLFKNADDAMESYYYRKKLHSDLTKFDFIYTFDPSKNNIDLQIDESVKKINLYIE